LRDENILAEFHHFGVDWLDSRLANHHTKANMETTSRDEKSPNERGNQ
jgi:hypothetical protein